MGRGPGVIGAATRSAWAARVGGADDSDPLGTESFATHHLPLTDAPDAYEQFHMAVVPVAGGAATLLTPTLDRPVSDAVWSKDGSQVTFVVSDDREVYVASVPAAGGTISRITKGQQVVRTLADSPADEPRVVLQVRRAGAAVGATGLPEAASL